jgi:hypothetical protein
VILYRFLFAPVLLLVAVLAGTPEKPLPAPSAAPAVEARQPAASSVPRRGTAPARGRRAEPPPVRAGR